MRPRRGIYLAAGYLLVVALLVLAAPDIGAAATQGRIWVNVLAPDGSFKDLPFSVSAIVDGRIVAQQEGSLEAPPNRESVLMDRLPVGACDIRVETEGMVTEVKRGVQVFETDRSVDVRLTPGQGVHIVEYAIGGLAREEVAARLAALDAAVAELRTGLAELKPE